MSDTSAATGHIEDLYPATPLQEGMLFHSLQAPAAGLYFEQAICDLTGDLRADLFREAWQRVVDRHVMLRTAFIWEEGRLFQAVLRQVSLTLDEHDWRDRGEAQQEEACQRLLAEDRARGFDLLHPPLMRVTLIRRADRVYRLIWSHHHVLADGWSTMLVFKEVAACYQALRQERPWTLPPARPYRDYIAWLQRQDPDPARAYWQATLGDLEEPTPLPESGGAAALIQEQVIVTLPRAITDRLQRWAARERLTMNSILQGLWGLQLCRYGDVQEAVFGATVSGRPAEIAGIESMVGLFITTPPVRVRIDPAQPIAEWLHRLHDEQVAAREFAHTPLVEIQAVTQVPRDRPLFESVLVYENYPTTAFEDAYGRAAGDDEASLAVRAGWIVEATNYPLVLRIVPNEQVELRVIYDPGRFDRPIMEYLADALRAAIEVIVARPQGRVEDLLVSGAREQETLARWNQTARVWPPAVSLVELFAAQAAQTPDAIALSADAGEVSYAVLAAQAGWLAAQLQARGVGPDRCVALVLPRGLELIVAILGVLQAGGAYVPLDPEAPPARLRQMLADVEAVVLLTDAATDVAALADACPVLVLAGETLGPAAGAPAAGARPVGLQPAHLAYVIYTSGSTGRPKAVAIPHAALTNHMRWLVEAFALTAADVILQKTPASFDAAVWECVAPLLTGGRLALAAPGEQRDPAQLVARLQQTQTTVVQFVPSVLAEVAAQPALAACRSLRVVCAGGEGFPVGLHARLTAALPETQIVNLYGPTEVTIDSTAWHGVPPARGILPLGRLMPNVQGYVREATGALAPIGARGELAIGGVSLARGYLGQPARTAAAFVPDAVSGAVGARLYRSGDQVRWQADGTLAFLGRRDQQVKFRGQRLELGEIEAALRRLPDVHQAVVVLRTEPPGPPRLVAYVVGPPSLQPARLRVALHAGLPAGLIPSVIVPLAQLPLTPHGKVDRRALPPPEPATAAPPGAPPRPGLEELVASLWTQVLGRAPTTRDAQFFALGGHSLLATQVSARLRAALGVEVPLRVLFEHPTLQALAAWLATARGASAPPRPPVSPVPRPPEGLPLSFAQQRLWFLSQLDPTSRAYLIPYALRLRGPLAGPALAHSLAAVVARHEILRTRLVAVHGEPRQVVDPTATLALPVIDLGALAPATQAAAVRARQTAEATRPVPLDQAPLLRATLLRLAPADHVLLLTWHHVISDGWSVALFVDELRAGYAAARQRRAPAWPALPVQYGDVAVWQRRWLTGDALATLTRYWRQQLAGLRTLPLPTDRPRPATPTHRGALQRVTWAAPRTVALRAFSQREGVTLFMTLLAGLALVLGRWAGEDEVALGTDVANRTQVETEGLLGFFVNQLVLRVTLPGAGTFRALLRHVRDVTLDAYAHQDLPFDRLVEELQPARQLAAAPLFQIKLVLQNVPTTSVEVAGLSISGSTVESGIARFDLTFGLTEEGDTIGGVIDYSADLFDPDTIASLLASLEQTLDAAMARPETPLRDIPITPAAERRRLLDDWNQTTQAIPEALTPQLFAAAARRTPEATALVFESRHLTYAALDQEANRLAHYLCSLGVGPEVFVGLFFDRGPEAIVAMLAIMKAGGAYVPIDPAHPTDRVAYVLNDTSTMLVLTTQRLAPRLPTGHFSIIALDADQDRIAGCPATEPAAVLLPEHLAYVIYTSGSAGRPKGVCISHGALRNMATLTVPGFPLSARDVVPQFASFAFDFSFWEWGRPLLAGGTVIIAAPDAAAGVGMAMLLENEMVTIATILPPVLAALPARPLPALRHLMVAGDTCPRDLPARWSRGRAFLNGYGPTETTIAATVTAPLDGDTLHIGRPLPNYRVYVLDSAGEPVPAGARGELYLGGAGVARGYLRQPALTAERFVPDPFSGEPGARLYRSGDFARWRTDANLEFLGRRDGQVKIRGYRIELQEIEAVLATQPGVREAAVVVRDDRSGEPRIVAYVAGDPDEPTRTVRYRSALQAVLPAYMIPDAFVLLDVLPRTASGKLDRQALPTHPMAEEAGTAYEPPRTAVEIVLADIWSTVLNRARAGVNDDFFASGGHSLLGAQLLAQIQDIFQIELPLRVIFELGTVAGLAHALLAAEPVPGQTACIADAFLVVKADSDVQPGQALSTAAEGAA